MVDVRFPILFCFPSSCSCVRSHCWWFLHIFLECTRLRCLLGSLGRLPVTLHRGILSIVIANTDGGLEPVLHLFFYVTKSAHVWSCLVVAGCLISFSPFKSVHFAQFSKLLEGGQKEVIYFKWYSLSRCRLFGRQ